MFHQNHLQLSLPLLRMEPLIPVRQERWDIFEILNTCSTFMIGIRKSHVIFPLLWGIYYDSTHITGLSFEFYGAGTSCERRGCYGSHRSVFLGRFLFVPEEYHKFICSIVTPHFIELSSVVCFGWHCKFFVGKH